MSASTWSVTDPGLGPVTLSSGATGASQLSGLAWAGGAQYYAVSDADPVLYPLQIAIDPATGAVRSAALSAGSPLAGGRDLEGLVFDAADGSVLVSDEVGPSIRRYRAAGGASVGALQVPTVFQRARRNKSLEGLSLASDGRVLWTANEEALAPDGGLSTFSDGTIVRLQRFTADAGGTRFTPAAQYAYATDAIPGDVFRRGRDVEASGVSELVALPDGGLLVLERAFGAIGTRSRLYLVDSSAATDISALAGLAGATYTPARKSLLWEKVFPDANFEGAALGPTLAGGGRSLILVSDNGHALRQALYALILRPGSATPS